VTRDLLDAMVTPTGPHLMRIDGQPSNAPVRFAALCTCEWTSGYFHPREVDGTLIDNLQDSHYTHRKLRRSNAH